MVINSRPLSYLTPDDLEEPLAPSHLLVGRRLSSLPDDLLPVEQEDYNPTTTPEILTKRTKFLNRILSGFWKRWEREYLLELRNSHLSNGNSDSDRKISEGDVVVVHDENKKRGFWRLGLVEELIVGRDGHVRGAKIRVSSGGKTSIWQRPVQRLYPLEINSKSEEEKEGSVGDDPSVISTIEPPAMDPIDGNQVESIVSPRPRRAAASEALNRIAIQTMTD